MAGSAAWSGVGRRQVGGGQAERHGEAAAGGVLRGEGAAHRLGEAAGQGQAEADAGVVVAVAEALERQEDPVPVGRPGCRGRGR